MPNNTTKPCHNCRRRRLRCDRSWPACHKCAVSGQECLGYGKVFVWTQGIDAQGNRRPPLGRSNSNSNSNSDSSNNFVTSRPAVDVGASPEAAHEGVRIGEPSASVHGVSAAATGGRVVDDDVEEIYGYSQDDRQDLHHVQGAHHQNQDYFSHQQPQHQPQSHFGQGYQQLPFHNQTHQGQIYTPSASSAVTTPDSSLSSASQAQQFEPVLGHLTDPVFQDLDRSSRYYLAHFADRVCQDLVARDSPGGNPFRELIPLTNKHPLLLQVLIATSAIHWSNIFRPITAIPTGLSDPGGYLAILRSKDLVSRKALIDALTAKQKAMGHLREVLDTLDPACSEVALASMHFFIKFDLIDLEKSDGKGWKAHLEGASNILAFLTPDSANNSATSRMLRDCVIADCFIYHILGSTLATGGLAARIAKYAFQLLPVMKRVEVNSYLSCPPEILQIILFASQLSHESPSTDWSLSAADRALSLIDEALNFDIAEWGRQLERSNVADIDSRIHVASAHRSAVCLYILQALPLARAVRPVDSDFLVGDILNHLSQIGVSDPYFKATSWPTFIAGAETRDAEKRTWALKRLLAIWEIIPWGYIFTAIEMLKATWHMQDNQGNEANVNWLQDLRGVGFDYLIV